MHIRRLLTLQQPDAERLSELFASLLNMQGEEKSRALAILKSALDSQQGEPWQTIRLISEFYPEDSGLFSPLLLNVVKLNLAKRCSCSLKHRTLTCKAWRWK